MTQTLLLIMALLVTLYVAGSYYYDNWVNRLAVLTLLVCLANAVYFSLDGAKGWPAEENDAVTGKLASVVVVNPSSEGPGAIYISLFLSKPSKWYEYVYPRYAPKTFFVEYSNDRAAQFEKAKEALAEGKEVQINGIPPKNSSDGKSAQGDSMMEVIGDILKKFLPDNRDTYKPKIPNVEIVEPQAPPEKGSNQ